MANRFKDQYKLLPTDKRSEFLLWATAKYGRKATSIENHWIGKGAVPDQWASEVLKKLEELSK